MVEVRSSNAIRSFETGRFHPKARNSQKYSLEKVLKIDDDDRTECGINIECFGNIQLAQESNLGNSI